MSPRATLIKLMVELVPSNHFVTDQDMQAIESEIGDDYSEENVRRALLALFHEGE